MSSATPGRRLWRVWLTAMVLAAAAGCATGPLSRIVRAPSPHEQYAETLTQAGLDATALGRDWLQAGEAALTRPIAAPTPFRETGYFPPERPEATAYRMDLRRGRRLEVAISLDGEAPARLFVDLFELQADGAAQRVASLAADAATLTYDVLRDATYVVRVQPELLRGGRFTIAQRTLASLAFPVSGLDATAVQSEFGAARDAGRRAHEGIDIFAPRGTPVLAVVGGVARTSTNGLGGNVVWLHDAKQRRTLYHAHLDRWAFDDTRTVQPGEVIGYVGNTGNARTTAPHLHFGVYDDGALDPLPFLAADEPLPGPVGAALAPLGRRVRVAQARVSLHDGPDTRTAATRGLTRASVATVLGVTGGMYRVQLPDGGLGYVTAAGVSPADSGYRRVQLASKTALHARPATAAPVVAYLDDAATADVLGLSEGFSLIRTADGLEGWVGPTEQSSRRRAPEMPRS